jgi:hypothetical protein
MEMFVLFNYSAKHNIIEKSVFIMIPLACDRHFILLTMIKLLLIVLYAEDKF